MTSNIKRPVLRYHGGKWLLGKWIISNFPQHRFYTEVFAGGASVLMQKRRSYAEVINDRWDTVVNVFEVLRDPDLANELKRQLELTPFSRTEFLKTEEVHISHITDPIEKARRTIFRSFAGFGSAATNAKYATGFRANSNRSGTTPAHDWVNYPSHIQSFIERLKGVVIENKNYKSVLQQHDNKETLHYVDPPYVHSTRNMKRGNAAYAFEFLDNDHIELAEVLNSMKGMIVISGYPSDLYNEIFNNWHCVSKESRADGAGKRTECLWFNHAAMVGHSQLKLDLY